ncbi:MAG TPA: glycosyl transferase [Cyanobacteria bacterium UBA11369]|nr:glycosyl transferase [Cyanobacteria bacterium UBA11371]HBE31791.1 glycosyl transferase [Cyanobacteria bacterium UBA11368]HBE50113.1 glycosyl transferase [Cyanobacteria bacterium UBA11369]
MAKQPPRIAMFLRDLGGGGAERAMVKLVQGFAKQGLKVDLLMTRAEGPYLSQVPPEVNIIDLKARQFDKSKTLKFPTSLQSTASLPKLVSYLRSQQPQALLSALHYPNEIAILAKRFSGVSTRIVVCEQSNISAEAKRVEQVSARLAPLTVRLFYPWADAIVAVSQGVAKDLNNLTKLPPERIRVIHNPVINPELDEKLKQPVEHPWFNSGEPPVILGVGRLVEQKDFSSLIRALAIVKRKQPARLMILGSGRQRQQLENLARELGLENDVALLGYSNNPYGYMKKASVFALSSAWEGLPTVLIEAMAIGTPVVSTNCESGPEEILDKGKYGDLVPVGDSEALAKAILKVLSGNFPLVDPAWLNQYKWETVIEQYLDILGVSPIVQSEI